MIMRVERRTTRLLLVVFLVLAFSGAARQPALAAGAQQTGLPEEVLLSNGFRIHFDRVDYLLDGTATWWYTVEELPEAKDLGYWVLEIPACAPILSAGPLSGTEVDPDPNTHLSGVKWEVDETFVTGQFWVKLGISSQVGLTNVAAKGPDVAYGEIAGPTCIVDPSTPGDVEPPTLTWVAPVAETGRYDVQDGDVVNLEVTATDNVAVERVEIIRWDAINEVFVTITEDASAPYQVTVLASDLNPEWNQVAAASYDTSGNRSDWKLIWLYKTAGEPVVEPGSIILYLPVLVR